MKSEKSLEYPYPVIGGNGIMGYSNEYLLKDQTLVLGRVGEYCGCVHISKSNSWITDNALYIKRFLIKEIIIEYLAYIYQSLDLNRFRNETGQPLITQPIVRSKQIPFPPLKEQKSIITFLKKKTTEIDALLTDNHRMVEKLQEYRQALISEAVTKGLDPEVEMRESEIEWIRDLPTNWEIKKLKYLANINLNNLSSKTNSDYEINYLDISNVTSTGEMLDIQNMLYKNAPSRARRIPETFDTIISTVRTYLKAVCYLDEIPNNLIVSTGFAVLHPNLMIKSKFLYYFVRGHYFIETVMKNSVGVSYPAINVSDLGSIKCLLPPIDSQKEIIKILEQKTEEINKNVLDIKIQIKNLNQYRQSLIFEAVTGKIDVRNNN